MKFVDSEDDEIQPQFFTAIEQKLYRECSSLTSAIFALHAIHYVCNIEYSSYVRDIFHFIDDKLLHLQVHPKETQHTQVLFLLCFLT